MSLKTKIKQKEAQIGVIGLGYVGLPLAIEFAKAGFSVTGIDIDESKTNGIFVPVGAAKQIGFVPNKLFFAP